MTTGVTDSTGLDESGSAGGILTRVPEISGEGGSEEAPFQAWKSEWLRQEDTLEKLHTLEVMWQKGGLCVEDGVTNEERQQEVTYQVEVV